MNTNKVVKFLYSLARTANTVNKVVSGNPEKIKTRVVNMIKGRVLARTGVYKLLYGRK